MFTGIIEEVGIIKMLLQKGDAYEMTVECHKVLEGTKYGDSIATNGVCLTATEIGSNYFRADVMPESVKHTDLSSLSVGSKVNLERAMLAGGRFDGHIVQGHVDGIGRIADIVNSGGNIEFVIEAEQEIIAQIVYKGSVALDGISLTVSGVDDKNFKVSIIPTTIKETALSSKSKGSQINIETDIIGRYVQRFLQRGELKAGKPKSQGSGLTMDFLTKNGF